MGLAAIDRGLSEVFSNDPVRLGVGPGDTAVHLLTGDPIREERERDRFRVAGLHLEAGPGNRPAVKASRCTGLEPTHLEAGCIETVGKGNGRRLPVAAGGYALVSPKDDPPEEGSGGQHDGFRLVGPAVGQAHAPHLFHVEHQVIHGTLDDVEVGVVSENALRGFPIEGAVDLSPGAAHRGSLGPVQHPELDSGSVGHPAHDAIEGIDLPDDVSLAETPDGRIA